MNQENIEEKLPRPIRRRLWKTLLLTGIFVGGMVLGGALAVKGIVNRMQDAVYAPEKTVSRVIRRMDRYLDLDDQQKAQVQLIIRDTLQELMDRRMETRKQTITQLGITRQEIAALLSDDQRQKMDQRFDRLQNMWAPKTR